MVVDKSSGPLKGIFYAHFHPSKGSEIKYQYPAECINASTFNKCTNFIIPKENIVRQIFSWKLDRFKIKGYPNKICDANYERNELLFNLCLVFDEYSRTKAYDPLIIKLSEYLCTIEIENGFLSDQASSLQLPSILKNVFYDLNTSGQSILNVSLPRPIQRRSTSQQNVSGRGSAAARAGSRSSLTSGCHSFIRNEAQGGNCAAVLAVKVVEECAKPRCVGEEEVPVLLKPEILTCLDQTDLTSQRMLPHINGVDHISKISMITNIELNLALKCVENLMYYDIVKLVPIFQYSNVYVADDQGLNQLYLSAILKQKCAEYVCLDPALPVVLDDLFYLYSIFDGLKSVADVVHYHIMPHSDINKQSSANSKEVTLKFPNIDLRRFVHFGVMHGILNRKHLYPVFDKRKKVKRTESASFFTSSVAVSIRKFCSGHNSVDLLCSKFRIPYKAMKARLDADPLITIVEAACISPRTPAPDVSMAYKAREPGLDAHHFK